MLKFQILLSRQILYVWLWDSQPTFEEFKDLLENLTTLHSEFYIFGDFNLQLDKRTAVAITFDDILTTFDLKHVTFSTYIYGHSLDPVIIAQHVTISRC